MQFVYILTFGSITLLVKGSLYVLVKIKYYLLCESPSEKIHGPLKEVVVA